MTLRRCREGRGLATQRVTSVSRLESDDCALKNDECCTKHADFLTKTVEDLLKT